MRIDSLNTELTESANHFVFNISRTPEIDVASLDWKALKVFIKDDHLHVVKPSTTAMDHDVLLAIASQIATAEMNQVKERKAAKQARQRMLKDISTALGIDLDNDSGRYNDES